MAGAMSSLAGGCRRGRRWCGRWVRLRGLFGVGAENKSGTNLAENNGEQARQDSRGQLSPHL